MAFRRALCAQDSRDRDEPLAATASRIEDWLLVEYRDAWSRDVLGGSRLSDAVKRHLSEQLAALPRSRLLFIRRRERRFEPGIVVYLASSREADPWLVGLELGGYDGLLDLDCARGRALGAPVDHPLLVVCTHGKRDRCCAAFGRAVYDELRAQPERHWVWQSTHVGGDRFAGNVVRLPEGLFYGRIGSEDARPLLESCRANEIWLRPYRGRSCYPFAVQAAERAVRERTGLVGLDGLDGLSLASAERDGDAWRVGFRAGAGGEVHEVEVRAEEGEPAYLTCGAATARSPRRYVVR